MDSSKTTKFLENVVQLVQEDDEVFASIGLNPNITLIKFILTDDKPNNNGMRIPKEEFSNLITTGLYMPIKMADKEPGDHPEAFPIGVITHLKEVGSKIKGLAVLWNRERAFDVDFIKERYSKNQPLNISWEILHKDSYIDKDNVENLTGVYLRAATLVDIPAYGGRTPVIEVISSDKNDDTTEEDKTLEEELKKNISLLEDSLKDKDTKLAELQASIDKLTKTQVTPEISKELKNLRDFKKEVEEERELDERKSTLRTLFKDKGVEKDDKYFEENEEMLLSLEESALEFIIQQEVKLTKASDDDNENPKKGSKNSSGVPNLSGDDEDDTSKLSPKEIGKMLREEKLNKNKGGSN